MNSGSLVFSQMVGLVHREQFDRCVSMYPMRRASRSFSARDQFLCMVFAQLTFRESLRDIEAGAFYVMDRGYVEFGRLASIETSRAFFVTRAKSNMSSYVRESRPVHKASEPRNRPENVQNPASDKREPVFECT